MAALDRLEVTGSDLGPLGSELPGVSREIQKKHILGRNERLTQRQITSPGVEKGKTCWFFFELVFSCSFFLVVFLWLVKLVLLSTYRSGTNLFFFAPPQFSFDSL